MSNGDKVSMFLNVKPIIFERVKAMIQHMKVAFRKSPSGDLGVKIKDIKGNTHPVVSGPTENEWVRIGFADFLFHLAVKKHIISA